MIAILEVEIWGEVFTREAKKFADPGPTVQQLGRKWGNNDDNAAYVSSMMADLGMED